MCRIPLRKSARASLCLHNSGSVVRNEKQLRKFLQPVSVLKRTLTSSLRRRLNQVSHCMWCLKPAPFPLRLKLSLAGTATSIISIATKFYRDKHVFIATNTCFSRQMRVCRNKTRLLPRQKICLSRQNFWSKQT